VTNEGVCDANAPAASRTVTAQLSGDDEAMDVQLLVILDCPNEQRAREMLRRALADAGAGDIPIQTVVVDTAEQAEQLGFPGSPTILLDRVDAFPSVQQSPGLACRMYSQPGGSHGVPEMVALVAAIRRHAAEHSSMQEVFPPVLNRRRSAAGQAAIGIVAGR